MRIAEIIGTVTLSELHPSLSGAAWRLAVPLSRDGLKDKQTGRGEPFIIYDERGARNGSQVAVSEGAEAAAPFHPNQIPIDAYNTAILDTVVVD